MKDLNLIPKNYYVEKKNKIKKAYLSILILCIGVVAVAVYLVPTIQEKNLKSEKAALEQKVSESKDYINTENEFNTLKQAIEVREQEVKQLGQKKLDLMGIFNAIEAASPEKLYILKFDTTGDDEASVEVKLGGIAEDEETIASFVRNLYDDAYFKEIGLAAITNPEELKDNKGKGFQITLKGVNKLNVTKYNGFDNNFNINLIDGWKVSKEEISKVLFEESIALTNAKPASVEVKLESTNLQVEDFTKERQSKLAESLKNYTFGYTKITKNSKLPATKTMYCAQEDNIQYQFVELCVVKDNDSYIVTYKTEVNRFANEEQSIDIILKSFNININ